MPLLLPVAVSRMLVGAPVFRLIGRMGLAPLAAAISHDLRVVRVRGDFVLVILSPAALLAGGLAADALVGAESGGLERSVAIHAQARRHRGNPPGSGWQPFSTAQPTSKQKV